MVNMVQKEVNNHLSKKELKDLVKSFKNDCLMYKRFVLIDAVDSGKKVSEICEMLKISEPTGHRWLDIYNEKGPEGLYPKYENSGRHSKLSDEQKEELFKILENEDYLTVQRAHQIIKDRYGINYTIKHTKTIIKNLDFNYGKPFQIFSQKPKDAKSQLKKI
jgi:putative transposase